MTSSPDINLRHDIPDPWTLPLESIDVSSAALYQQDKHGEYFRRLRLEDPVHYCKESLFGPYWSVTKFDHIVEIDTNHKAFSSQDHILIGDLPAEFIPRSFLAADQPLHDIQRRAVQPAVTPNRLAELETLIRQRAGEILDGLPIGKEIDWVESVSKKLTSQMLATLFDIPDEDAHLLPYWSDIMTATQSVGTLGVDEQARQQIMFEMTSYFAKVWDERAAAEPKFDFISLLAHNPDTKDMRKDPMDFLGNIMTLVIGGNDTTRHSISGGVVFLNQFPDEFRKLKADPSLIPNMVSEIIRFQTPIAHMRRTALEDVEFHGKHIRKGDKVVMWYVSGNRDDEVISEADIFRIDRERARHHLSFGFGIHRCIGNRMAELQLRVLWEEILKRFDNIELVGEVLRPATNFTLGYTKVPVIVNAK